DLDVRGCFLLVRDGERVEDLRDRARADLRELFKGLPCLRVQWIAHSADHTDQPLSFQIRKETHPALRSALSCVTHYATAAALPSAPRGPSPSRSVHSSHEYST